jgi:hypothetical protein
VRSAVDNRPSKRLLYAVLAHGPTPDAITGFLGRLNTALEERAFERQGSTTDGSARSPEPLQEVCGEVPHQRCPVQVIAERIKGILRAVASERQRLEASQPQRKRGRPSSKDQAARRLARPSKHRQQKSSDFFPHRLVFVKRRGKPSAHQRFRHITRGLPPLRKRRAIMDHISGLSAAAARRQLATSAESCTTGSNGSSGLGTA